MANGQRKVKQPFLSVRSLLTYEITYHFVDDLQAMTGGDGMLPKVKRSLYLLNSKWRTLSHLCPRLHEGIDTPVLKKQSGAPLIITAGCV